jgi:hypothetical protein
MTRIFAKHEPYDDGHLGEVVAEMLLAGWPTIRVVAAPGGYAALEGSHRLAAAHWLGLGVKLVELEPDGHLAANWHLLERLPRYDWPTGGLLLLVVEAL